MHNDSIKKRTTTMNSACVLNLYNTLFKESLRLIPLSSCDFVPNKSVKGKINMNV